MRDEYFYEYTSTIFAHSDSEYVEKSKKKDCIIILSEDYEDEVLELLRGLNGQETFDRILEEHYLQRVDKCQYMMDEEELKNRVFDMN